MNPTTRAVPNQPITDHKEITMVKQRLITKEGLPREAFAITGNPEDPSTWQLPHHTKSILRALKGNLELEETIDCEEISRAVIGLSPKRYGQRVSADPEQILIAAKHLASHYTKARKPLPDILAALV